ncbi:MAG TPA: N-acetyltransferase family protein [Syntrophomonadaceae bacterium]|nr:N-acetyltransferase family protein [Syntrophomonadaceae bacterium]HPR94279.1 N-acetyltransferase family protein [Syntrophomonadaceae bacterium]
MNIIFEEMQEKHLGEVLSIYTYYVLNTTATFHDHELSESEMREIVFFENPKYRTYVIKSSGNICGYVILSQYKKREAYDRTAEVSVYLKPDSIGQGIGSQALKFIEDTAVSQKMHVLIATICGENSKSMHLFERNGYNKCAHYKEVGEKFGQLLDIVTYQKIIS